MIRVIIVDNHPVVRQGIRQIFASEKDIQIVGEVGSAKEAIRVIRQTECDVVILDISLPDGSGLDVLKWLKFERTELPVLIMSIHDEQKYAMRAFKSGAQGYLIKNSIPEEFVKALRKIAAGGKYISSILAESLVVRDVSFKQLPHNKLSRRESQIFYLISTGKPLKEISAELQISAKTVSTHKTRILSKMNMKNNADLIYYALHNKLIH